MRGAHATFRTRGREQLSGDGGRGCANCSAKRNGARHCCQAPLRRAKDLPVFVTLISRPEGPKTRPRSWRTSSGVAFHHGGPKTRSVVRFSSRESLAPQLPSAWPEGFRDLDVPRPFLGWVPSTQLCLPGGETALVQGSTNSSGASCRLVRNSVRCVIAPKDSSASNLIPSPAGGDRSFRLRRTFLPLPAFR